jgi:P27 family predicted phage terminase small subunit
MQIDHKPDGQALEVASLAYARVIEAELTIEREGFVINEPVYFQGKRLGRVFRKKKHPAVTVANAAMALLKTFVCEFGLTPVSRTRLTIERTHDAADDLNKLLRGPRLTPEERAKLQ